MFFLLLIIGWGLWLGGPYIPTAIWVCYWLAWATWLVKLGWQFKKWY